MLDQYPPAFPIKNRLTGPSVIDEVEPSAPKLPTAKRRGRPPGSRSAFATAGRNLKSDEFAYLRARLQGVTASASGRQYLPHIHETKIEAYEVDLFERLRLTVGASTDTYLKDALTVYLGAPEPPSPAVKPTTTGATQKPTLEQFAERFPEDMYSEAELVELYEEEDWTEFETPIATHQPAQAQAASLSERIQALHTLQLGFTKTVTSNDPIRLWFSAKVTSELARQRAFSISDFARWINLSGPRWNKHLKGVGITGASKIEAWLSANESFVGVKITNGILTPRVDHTREQTQDWLKPLDDLAWPSNLLGQSGGFRAVGPNTLGATNDQEAVFSWLGTLSEKSGLTVDNYHRAIERLVLWALFERKRALSSLTTEDISEFKEFLRAPPAHWVGKGVKLKSSAAWRPMRSGANAATLRLIMSAVGKMFKDWTNARYLTGNSVSLASTVSRREMTLDVHRSFSKQDIAPIKETLDAMEDSPSKNRLRAVIILLKMAGLRRAEACSVTWKNIHRLRVDNEQTDMYALTFLGKGQRERTVPLHPEIVAALSVHYEDRMRLVISGKLARYAAVPRAETPLLSILDERLASFAQGTRGDSPHNAERNQNSNGAISQNRLNGLLKAFFRDVARNSNAEHADYLSASPHWFRHTFALDALASTDKDLPTVQGLLGHADLSTTGIYTKAKNGQKAKAIMGMDTGM